MNKNDVENVTALIMAGGKGTRLRPLSHYFQKAMIPIGGRFKPVIEYIIRNIVLHNITDIVIAVNYKAEQVINYLKYNKIPDISIKFLKDRGRGNALALLDALDKKMLRGEHILVHYGDILTNLYLSRLISFHVSNSCDLTLVVVRGYKLPIGIVRVQNNTISGIYEKPVLEIDYGIGIFVFRKNILSKLRKIYNEAEIAQSDEFDIATHVLPALVKSRVKACAYRPLRRDFFWIDIGSINVYENLDHNLIDNVFSYLFK